MSARDLKSKLQDLTDRKKRNEITAKDYYSGLLDLFAELIGNLKEELMHNMKDEDVKRQSSLLLITLRQQIDLLEQREA